MIFVPSRGSSECRCHIGDIPTLKTRDVQGKDGRLAVVKVDSRRDLGQRKRQIQKSTRVVRQGIERKAIEILEDRIESRQHSVMKCPSVAVAASESAVRALCLSRHSPIASKFLKIRELLRKKRASCFD